MKIHFSKNKEQGNSREGQFEVVGFDAANIVWSGCVQGLHQHLQRVTELQEKQHHDHYKYYYHYQTRTE